MDSVRTRKQMRCGCRGRNVCVKLGAAQGQTDQKVCTVRSCLFLTALKSIESLFDCHNLGRDMKQEKPSARFSGQDRCVIRRRRFDRCMCLMWGKAVTAAAEFRPRSAWGGICKRVDIESRCQKVCGEERTERAARRMTG